LLCIRWFHRKTQALPISFHTDCQATKLRCRGTIPPGPFRSYLREKKLHVSGVVYNITITTRVHYAMYNITWVRKIVTIERKSVLRLWVSIEEQNE